MALPELIFFVAVIVAGCLGLAALCRHSRVRLRRIQIFNKGIEHRAAEQGELLHAIFAAVPVGTWSHDLISNRVVLEGRINEVYGFPAERTECSFEEILQSVHPEDRAKMLDASLTSQENSPSIDFEFRAKPPGGATRWILSVGGVSRFVDGKPACLGGIILDITRRKEAEIALRQSEGEVRKLNETLEARVRIRTNELLDSERRFHRMVEGVQDYAIFMLDTDGRVVSWNLGAERSKGYTAAEIIGKHVSTFYPEEEILRGFPEEELRHAAAQGRFERDGWRVRRDGSRFWANVVVAAVQDASGELCGFSKVTRDISERKLAHQQLEEQRSRAEKANQAKSDFLAAMSHEIRTPMNAILGMSDLLWDTDLNEDQRHYVEIFRSAGANLLDLINNILDLSKIESGHLELDRTEFNLERAVAGVVELLGPKANDKGLVLRARLAPEVTKHLIGDPARLRQILVNLAGNAIKFTKSGEVTISAENRQDGHPGEISFTVSDTGMGISPEKLDAIFDAFSQADSSISGKYGGTGLGLAICRRLVESMGGSIRVESEPGRGSAFHFTACFEMGSLDQEKLEAPAGTNKNAHSGVHAASGAEPTPAEQISHRKLLVAEDSLDNQYVIKEYLKNRPYALVFVEDGAAAVELCRGEHGNGFAAVLMDMQMPVMDGLTATRAIRENERSLGGPAVPILALTANDGREDIEACRLAGCTAHLSKPVSRAALLRALEDLLTEQSAAQPLAPMLITPPEGLEHLAPRYLSARRKEVQEMVALLAGADFEKISSRGHNLKGTGRSYGFPDLSDIGAALERFAEHRDREGIDKQLLRLANYLESVRVQAEVGRVP
jgi:PAS domain S-box-containing protein